MDVSFGTIWEAIAGKQPDAVAISEPARDYTYAEFEERSARLAAALTDAGVAPGDKVACYLYNGAAYLETVFAAFKIGAVPVNANYRYTGTSCRHCSPMPTPPPSSSAGSSRQTSPTRRGACRGCACWSGSGPPG
jgi:acyl-CoA synthetase (AMP-forming)/AMP-acid ligase II